MPGMRGLSSDSTARVRGHGAWDRAGDRGHARHNGSRIGQESILRARRMNSNSERTVPIVEDGIAGLWPLPRARSVGFGLERSCSSALAHALPRSRYAFQVEHVHALYVVGSPRHTGTCLGIQPRSPTFVSIVKYHYRYSEPRQTLWTIGTPSRFFSA
jgi:hypothetical protein